MRLLYCFKTRVVEELFHNKGRRKKCADGVNITNNDRFNLKKSILK